MDDRNLKVLMIRHSVSLYNSFAKQKLEEVGVESEDEILFVKVPRRPELLDCALSPEGHALAQRVARESAGALGKVKLVLCTAARRALQTTQHLFGGREGVVVIVLPFFERMESLGDVMAHTAAHAAEFPQFDFAPVRRVLDKHGWAWFVHQLENPVTRQELLAAVAEPAEPEAQGFRVVDYMRAKLPQLLESFPDFHARLRRHKETVRRFLSRPELAHLRDGEVAIVAHNNFNRFFVAEQFDAEWYPSPCTPFSNCEVKEYTLNLFGEL